MVKLFERFNDDKKLEQDINDILVELRDMQINWKIDITSDKFRKIYNECNLIIDINGSWLSDRIVLFNNKDVYPYFMMLDEYLEKYNAKLISIQYYATVNGGTFTEIPQNEDIELISSIRIIYKWDEN